MGRAFIALLLCLLPGAVAVAQRTGGPDAVVLMIDVEGGVPTDDATDHAWWERLRGARAADAPPLVPVPGDPLAPDAAPAGVLPARLAPFRTVEQLLVAARARAARLEEGEALGLIARALRIVETHPDVPRAAAWMAEVHTAMGLVAAQAGLEELMDASFSRAALLDPRRVVGAAEARPEVVERARAIAREVATRPSGRFEVHCDAPRAVVFLDDRPVGGCDAEVRAPVGRHLLQIRAPGRVPWGGQLDVFEGARAPVFVALAPLPEVLWAQAVSGAVARGQLAQALGLLSAPPPGVAGAWLLETASASGRALLTRCDDRGCAEPVRLAPGGSPPAGMGVPRAPRGLARALAEGRGWLVPDEGPAEPPAEASPWYRRWYVWVPVAVVVAGFATGAALAARPAPAQQLDITVDFGGLGPGATAP